MVEQQMSAEARRLASDRAWFGYLTMENLDAVADRIRRMLDAGQRYTWVAVNEGRGYKPEVRTGQVAMKVEAWRLETGSSGEPYGGITVNDTYGTWGIHTTAIDQRAAQKQVSRDKAFIHIEHGQIRVEHYAPAGHRLRWVAALEVDE